MNYFKKYLKYKNKYLYLKNQTGGNLDIILNLMWINKQINETDKYIFPEEQLRNEVKYKFNNQIEQWLKKEYILFLWYDENTVKKEQISNTVKLFIKYDNFNLVPIQAILETYYESCLNWQIYLKVDFLRLYVLKYWMYHKNNFKYNYILYSDMLNTAIEKKYIFDEKNLDNFGIVVSDTKKGDTGSIEGFENSFIGIKLNNNDLLVEYTKIIKVSFNYAMKEIISKQVANENEYFYRILKFIFIIFQNITHYKKTINYSNFNELYKILDINSKTFISSKNPNYVNMLPITKTFNSYVSPSLLKKGVKPKETKKTYDFALPVIEIDRPINKGKYN